MKRLGITPRLYVDTATNELRCTIDSRWISFLNLQSFQPIILPYGIDIEKYMHDFNITGVILTGGGDLSVISHLEIDSLRDDFERKILNYCQSNQYPVLGVCRGMQFIAVENGAEIFKVDEHVGTSHQVIDSCGFFESSSFKVNSYHQYSTTLPPRFISLAETDHKQIESFRNHDNSLFGVMWHPERNKTITSEDSILFQKVFGGLK
jgi:gamma-glutamyl-gamma-aminobutyrate hydrolase PuuD